MLFSPQTKRYAFAVSNCAGGMNKWVEMEWKPIQVAGLLLMSGPPVKDVTMLPISVGNVNMRGASQLLGTYSSPSGFIFSGAFDAREVVVSLDEGSGSPLH